MRERCRAMFARDKLDARRMVRLLESLDSNRMKRVLMEADREKIR